MDIDIQLLMYKSIFMYVAKDHVLHSRENISVRRCFSGFYEYICDTLINIVLMHQCKLGIHNVQPRR